MIIDEILRAIVQIIVLAIIPVICWLFATKAKTSFFKWIGLKKPIITDKKKFYISVVIAIFVIVFMSIILDPILPKDIQLANARFRGQGVKALLPAFIFSFFATSLPEEILFRGFLGKRVFGKLGFLTGNTIQAILFGLLHGATMFGLFDVKIPLLVIFLTGTLGWLMGYVNEKASGSIVPSWLLHAGANTFASILLMFELT